MNTKEQQSSIELKIGLRSLALAASILLVLIILTGVLSRAIPSGSYERIETGGRAEVIEGSFSYTESEPVPVWRWFTAPVEVLWGPDAVTIISIILFMCLIAGAMHVMNKGDILSYIIISIVGRFSEKRFLMEASIILIFMLFGSILGSMEEVVVLVPILVLLARSMGWDSLTGLGLSLGAIAFGFASAISNPFTVGVAQKIADVPLFSGAPYRIVIFIVIYLLYTGYVIYHSKRSSSIESIDPAALQETLAVSGETNPKMRRAVTWFVTVMIIMVAMIIIASNIEALSSLVLVVVMLFFLIAGLGSGIISGMGARQLGSYMGEGILNVLPGAVLVLMASSIKYIMAQAGIMDTILYVASTKISGSGPLTAVLMIYLLVLVLNFFISSGSAKAFLIIPIITPLADLVGLSRQTAILAFVFGDGFSNIFYPTNALLLICLSITGISYGRWFRFIWKIELIIFAVSILFLLLAVGIGY